MWLHGYRTYGLKDEVCYIFCSALFYMATPLCGYTDLWLIKNEVHYIILQCLAWLCGYAAMWLCGYVATRLQVKIELRLNTWLI